SGSPYLIEDEADLRSLGYSESNYTLASEVNFFRLTNDITLSSDNFRGIRGFKGTFLGDNYRIINLTKTGKTTGSSGDNLSGGLFHNLSSTCAIVNVVLEDV